MPEGVLCAVAECDQLIVDVLQQRALQRHVRPGVGGCEPEDEQRRQGQQQPESKRHLSS